jgi:hypothetical protein
MGPPEALEACLARLAAMTIDALCVARQIHEEPCLER